VYSAGRDGNINSQCDICFVAVSQFVRENKGDCIASTNSITVQPHVRFKPELSGSVRMVVLGFGQAIYSILESETE
jgi:hypothetical protein